MYVCMYVCVCVCVCPLYLYIYIYLSVGLSVVSLSIDTRLFQTLLFIILIQQLYSNYTAQVCVPCCPRCKAIRHMYRRELKNGYFPLFYHRFQHRIC